MRSYAAIDVEPVPGFGVEVKPSVNAEFVAVKSPLQKSEMDSIAATTRFVGKKNVSVLEREATVVWVRNREHITDRAAVAQRVHALKPHISIAEALEADVDVNTNLTLISKQSSPV